MRARTKRFSVIGTALGLVLAAGVVVAPAAAPPASAAVGCSYFNGLTTVSAWVKESVSLRAGDVITAKAGPAVAGDVINLAGGPGSLIGFYSGSAVTGLEYTAPVNATYSLGWDFDALGAQPSAVTWSFTAKCSSTTVSPTPTPTPTATTKPGKGKGK